MGTSLEELLGFQKTEHFLHRTTESDDPVDFGFSFSANDLSCTTEATIGRSSPVVTMLLQFREAAPGIEVWTPSQDSRHAGGLDQAAADIPGYFLGNADCLDL